MGIYLQGVARRGRKLGREPQKAIRESAARWARDRGLQDFLHAPAYADPAWTPVSIFPPAGVIWFSIGDERVSFGTKTSVTGPGYHAALIDLCDHLQRELDLVWRWDTEGDSSGYAASRSLAELYEAYLGQLRAQCDFFRTQDSGLNFVMNLEIGLGGDETGKVSAPMGPFPLDEVAAFAEADDESLTEFARRFYPWWRQDIDGEFWTSALRAMLSADAPWRKPGTDWERHVCRAISAASLAVVRTVKRLPPDLEAALADLHKAMGSDAAPPMGEIGYRRRKRSFDLAGDWKIQAPGYYHETVEGDDGGTLCLWHPACEEIRTTSFVLKMNTAAPYNWGEKLNDQREYSADSHVFRIDPTQKEANAEGWRTVTAHCVAQEGDSIHLQLLSVTTRLDDAAARTRLETVAKTCLRFEPQQRPDKPLNA